MIPIWLKFSLTYTHTQKEISEEKAFREGTVSLMPFHNLCTIHIQTVEKGGPTVFTAKCMRLCLMQKNR